MDSGQFDAVARSLATGATRRRAWGALLGGLVAFAGSGRVWDESKAKRKKRKKKKKKKVLASPPPSPPTAPPPEGGTDGCATAADCAKPGSPCLKATCTNGVCGEALIPDFAQPGNPCDDGLFCNGLETCKASGACQPGIPPDCNDGLACTDDLCDENAKACKYITLDAKCGPDEVCHLTEGCVCAGTATRCGPSCVLAGTSCNTGQLGRCAAGTLQCINDVPQCVRNLGPIPETCNGIDDDCDGVVDNGTNAQLCPPLLNCREGQCGIF